MSQFYSCFDTAAKALRDDMLKSGQVVHTERWQSVPILHRPEAEMRELLHPFFQVLMFSKDLDTYRKDIQPNLPWADQHFELERVGGHPLNPGETWRDWPWALSADKFRTLPHGLFSHSYAERFWPKYAGMYDPVGGELPFEYMPETHEMNRGIHFHYGDLMDVVELLKREPLTRQAYVPIWFPEDTGAVHGERVPCTLGYHFLRRGEQLHVFYAIRSCDLIRHFRDDLYLTVRLVLWLLDQLKEAETWENVRPGLFSFWAGSLHCFINDFHQIRRQHG